jgi:hypothetical protein
MALSDAREMARTIDLRNATDDFLANEYFGYKAIQKHGYTALTNFFSDFATAQWNIEAQCGGDMQKFSVKCGDFYHYGGILSMISSDNSTLQLLFCQQFFEMAPLRAQIEWVSKAVEGVWTMLRKGAWANRFNVDRYHRNQG